MPRTQQIANRRTRTRNLNAVRMFNLRILDPPYVGGQQSRVVHRSSRVRRRAGRQAWNTRLERYGPTGRNLTAIVGSPGHVFLSPHHGQKDRRVLFDNDDEPDRESQERRLDVQHLIQDDLEHEGMLDEHQDFSDGPESLTSNSRQLDSPSQTPLSQLGHRHDVDPVDEVLQIPTSGEEEQAGISAARHIQEMSRLLAERRARTLGPQNITRRSRRRRGPSSGSSDENGIGSEDVPVIIFEDVIPPDTVQEAAEDDPNKENAIPPWFGGPAPPAPGARRAATPDI